MEGGLKYIGWEVKGGFISRSREVEGSFKYSQTNLSK